MILKAASRWRVVLLAARCSRERSSADIDVAIRRTRRSHGGKNVFNLTCRVLPYAALALGQPDDIPLDPSLQFVDASSGDDLAVRAHAVGVDECPCFMAGHPVVR